MFDRYEPPARSRRIALSFLNRLSTMTSVILMPVPTIWVPQNRLSQRIDLLRGRLVAEEGDQVEVVRALDLVGVREADRVGLVGPSGQAVGRRRLLGGGDAADVLRALQRRARGGAEVRAVVRALVAGVLALLVEAGKHVDRGLPLLDAVDRVLDRPELAPLQQPLVEPLALACRASSRSGFATRAGRRPGCWGCRSRGTWGRAPNRPGTSPGAPRARSPGCWRQREALRRARWG